MIKDPEKWLELVKAKEQDLRDACIQAAKKAWEGEVQKGMEVRVYLTLQSGDITIKTSPSEDVLIITIFNDTIPLKDYFEGDCCAKEKSPAENGVAPGSAPCGNH